MSDAVSPLAPSTYPDMPAIAGVRIATAAAGIKYRGRTDVLMIVLDEGTSVAGVFTTSRCPSAPVDFCRANLPGGAARAVVVNSGNANAFTGRRGRETTQATAEAAAQAAAAQAEVARARADARATAAAAKARADLDAAEMEWLELEEKKSAMTG